MKSTDAGSWVRGVAGSFGKMKLVGRMDGNGKIIFISLYIL